MFHFFRKNREFTETLINAANFLGQSVISAYFYHQPQTHKYQLSQQKFIFNLQNLPEKKLTSPTPHFK